MSALRRIRASSYPIWLPRANGVLPALSAHFTKEGQGGAYWYNGRQFSLFTDWLSAIGGTFTRATTAYRVNSSGLLESVASGAPRFSYSVAGAAKGILFEGARTNLLLWNRDLTNAAWTASNVTVAKDQTGADGAAASASSLTATGANGTVLQAVTSGSATRAVAAYVKRITGTGEIDITVDGGSTWTNITASINSSTFTRVPTAGGLVQAAVTNPSVGFRLVTSGDKIAVDFVTLESAAFASSPTLTTTASFARNADAPTTTVASIAGFSQSAGTMMCKFSVVPGATATRQMAIALSSPPVGGANDIAIDVNTTGQYRAYIENAGSVVASWLTLGAATADTPATVALAWAANDANSAINGVAQTTDTSIAVPSMTNLGLGYYVDSGTVAPLFGHEESFSYWPFRVPNAEMARLIA